jgi:hypothetical protein
MIANDTVDSSQEAVSEALLKRGELLRRAATIVP